MNSLKEKYQKEIIPALKKEFGFKNVFEVPRIEKIVIHSGIGRLVTQNAQRKEHILKEVSDILSKVTGQKVALMNAKQSVSGFKLREGMTVGLKVTLRGNRAYDFLSRLIGTALPRSRDFEGLSRKSIGLQGVLDIGLKEHIAFPEVAQISTSFIYGFQVTIVPTTKRKEVAEKLYELLGFPFKS